MEHNFYGVPDDLLHMSGFLGQDEIYIIPEVLIQKSSLRMYFIHNQLVGIHMFGWVISMD
jgi:hypothetical protein